MVLVPHSPIRQVAQTYLTRVQNNLPLASSGLGAAKASLYAEFTGNDQNYYDTIWQTNPRITGCNAFVGTYCRRGLGGGTGPFAGGFYMDTATPKAWVPSQDNWPQYGDICLKADRGHVFVIMNDDPYTTIQAGWNGSGKGYGVDTIGVSEGGTFDPSAVLGWLDIDKLFPQKQTVPYWVLGWWSVTWDEDVYYYYFATDWQVYWTYRRPRSMTEIMAHTPADGGAGKFSVGQSLNINWRSGSIEQYWFGDSSWPMQFWGTHNGEGVLQMDRLE